MKKCLIIINNLSGRAKWIDIEVIKTHIGEDYLFDCKYFDEYFDICQYDTLAVCGGDGTLSSIMDRVKDTNINIVYFPFGTVNDRARTASKYPSTKYVIGNINGKTFTYVAACGTFTAIGYVTRLDKKRKYKSLAYFLQAFGEYKVHHIQAKLTTDTETFNGEYTLIMTIKSKHCFHFPFNKLYNSDQLNAHLLLIKSPKLRGLLGNIQLFFRFFRVFFVGLNKQIRNKNIVFVPFNNLFMYLPDNADFCIDGEKHTLGGNINVNLRYACPSFTLISQKAYKHKAHKHKLKPTNTKPTSTKPTKQKISKQETYSQKTCNQKVHKQKTYKQKIQKQKTIHKN